MEKLKLLHQQVLPFILRREKEQVLQDLPPKIITTILCEMSPFQTQLYSNFCSGSEAKKSLDSLQKVIESAKNPDSANKKSSKLGADVLKSFLYLRLLCTYPSLVHTGTERWVATERDSIEFSGKLMALSELLRNAGIQRQTDMLTAADNDSSLIYCDSDDDDEMNKNELDEVFKPESFDPSLSSFNESDSKKKSKCLIFAQFTRSLDVVEKLLLQPNMTSDVGYIRLDGRVPLSERSKVVDIFNSDENIRIMLLTTRIGGLGLNLTGMFNFF
jgi:TATA-binding protein-associated factor